MIQADHAIGNKTTIFTNHNSLTDNGWTENVAINTYKNSIILAYMLPTVIDHVGLKRVFEETDSDVVHAHNLPCAHYSHNLGLPTIFDDWEYFLEYYNYKPSIHLINKKSIPFRIYRQHIAEHAVKKLIKEVPTIVTNKNVQQQYERLGGKNIQVIPNVPNQKERETALKGKWRKKPRTTTCYIGAMTQDSQMPLRNTSGIKEAWQTDKLGDLIVFEANNYKPHLQLFKTIRECHYNLLYWRPLHVHRYYLQNKAFLASIVGVPTIISSSLTATIDLLGEFAIPVDSLSDIKDVIKQNVTVDVDYPKKEHLLDFYAPQLKEIYNN